MFLILKELRKKLIPRSGRFSRYLLYALGEIVLVVAGILIALQINTWNEDRQLQRQEISMYQEIRTDLLDSQSEMQRTIRSHQQYLGYGKKLVATLQQKIPLNDSLVQYYTRNITDLDIVVKSGGFENLKAAGLNLLENDSLRKAITSFYQFTIPRLLSEDVTWNIYEIGLVDHYKYLALNESETRTETFTYTDELVMNQWMIRDYEDLLKDMEFMRRAQQILLIRSRKIEKLHETREEMNALVTQIDSELDRKKAM